MGRQVWIAVLGGLLAVGGASGTAAPGGAPKTGEQSRGIEGVSDTGWAASKGEDRDGRGGFTCSNRTLKGTYGIQMQGTRPVPPPAGGGFESMIGVVLRTYDGQGNFTQVDNVKGAVTGIVPDREGSGTYQVNPDCSASTQFQPGPGQLVEETMVIVDAGREIRSITVSPAPVMVTTVQQRIDRR